MQPSGRADLSKPSNVQKKRAQKRGRWAEFLARVVLRLSGHRILATNYKTKVGEIDLITHKNNVIGFVEVKARATVSDAAEAIGHKQRSRIQRAGEHFLAFQPEFQNTDIRFDVALVTGPFKIKIIYDAWRP